MTTPRRFAPALLALAAAIAPARAAPVTIQTTELAPGVYQLDITANPADAPAPIELAADDGSRWTATVRPLARVARVARAGVPGLELAWPARPNEVITGLGERFDALDQSGSRVDMWIEDCPLQPNGQSYFCAPILYSSAGYALAATDNPDSLFDLNRAHDNVNRYQRAGGRLSLIVALRPTMREQVSALMPHLGLPSPIPDWAWGPWISRNSYETQQQAEDALRGMLDRDLPVAAIVQEAWKGPSEQGQFNTWASPGWPDPDAFLAFCDDHHVRNILWQVPVLHPTSPLFADAERHGYLVRRQDGSVSFREHWLAGFANIDMTNPAAVAWWQDLMRPLVRAGVAGFKTDDGEDIKPPDVYHDGRRGWQLHNAYSVLYARAVTELFEQEHADAILWGRSGSLGSQRSPALWAGDQQATWAQMRTLIPAGLSVGLSGMPFWGHDIGGYAGQPSPELYIRWVQLGALSPMMQYHGVRAREPWTFGDEAEHAYTLAARARMNLVPHLQRLARESTETGVPIMRPMAMVFPDDPRLAREDTQYMLGDDLLVAPVLEPGSPGREVLIPAGRWRLATQRVVYDGPASVRVPIGLVDLPLLVRAGASIDLTLHAGEALGHWDKDAPVRAVSGWGEGPVLTDLRAPLRASTAPAPVEVRFRAPDPAAIRVLWRWRDGVGAWRTAPIKSTGNEVTVDLTPPPGERTPGRRQAYRVVGAHAGEPVEFLSAEVWYRAPIEVTLAAPPPAIASTPTPIAVRVHNMVDDPLDLSVRWTSDDAKVESPPTSRVRLAPGETTTLTWRATRVDDRVGALAAALVFEQSGRTILEWAVPAQGAPRWAVVGPFDAGSADRRLYGRLLGPGYVHDPGVEFGEGGPRWRTLDPASLANGGHLDFGAIFGACDHAAAYAMTKLRSARAQPAELRFGSDDTLVVWVNGRRVYSVETYRSAAPDQEVVPVRLRAGVNTVVVQVAQDINAWEMFWRLTGVGGSSIEGVTDGFDDFDAYAPDRPGARATVTPRDLAWQARGPVPWDRAPTADAPDLASDRGAIEDEGAWRALAGDPGAIGGVDLTDLFGRAGNQVVYLRATVPAGRARDVIIRAGSDDGLVVWHNGRRVWVREIGRVFSGEEDTIPVHLVAGVNTLVFRVSQLGGEWRFQAEFYDADTDLPIRLETR